MSNPLGRIEDLPDEYVQDLRDLNLVPLWPSLRSVLPPHVPTRHTQPIHWPYRSLRPLLLKSAELAPIEKAERRVLVLANPGHGLDKMQASAAMYLGMQLLMPGEWAPSHKHTPNAVRMIVEGEGAYTTVNGEKCPMHRGDLILTPTGLWHEHGHEGNAPVIWLDVLDLPLVYYMEASYHVNGPPQKVKFQRSDIPYPPAGVVPTQVFERSTETYPVLRYAWKAVKTALEALANDFPELECIQVTYTNPQTGADVENILGFYSLMLRPGQMLRLPARSPAQVFHVIEGLVQVEPGQSKFLMNEADTCCAPGYEPVLLINMNPHDPAFLFMADESPLHRKLGVYEIRN